MGEQVAAGLKKEKPARIVNKARRVIDFIISRIPIAFPSPLRIRRRRESRVSLNQRGTSTLTSHSCGLLIEVVG